MRQIKIIQTITRRDSNNLEKYFNDVAKIEMLTPEEEVMLAKRIREGDEQALEKLVLGNLRFVISVAKQYHRSGISLSDLINEGNMGLIKAAHRFDESRGFKFISYAVWWIQQSILQYIDKYSRFIRLPANKIAAMSKLKKLDIDWEQHHERAATEEELAELTEKSIREIKNVRNHEFKFSSVDKPFREGEMGSLLDVLENVNADDVEESLTYHDSLKSDVERLLTVLDEKERKIIKLHFGLEQDHPVTLGDIGAELGISRERVRQLKDRALKKLMNSPARKLLIAYLA